MCLQNFEMQKMFVLLLGSRSYTIGPPNEENGKHSGINQVTTERLDDVTTTTNIEKPKSLRTTLIENNLTVMEALLR